MEGHSPHIFSLSPITAAFVFIVLVSAALLIYHFIILAWCRRREIILITRHHQELPGRTSFQDPTSSSSLENSITSLIPPCKYTKDVGLVSKSEDVTCAVCLSEFKDGEPVRVLPECLHTFHVPCIDMWLFSHSNCPICRADTGVSKPVHHRQSQYNTTTRLPDFTGLRSAL